MIRRIPRLLLAVVMGVSLPSCATYALWAWATGPTYPSQVVGVVQEEDARAVVYALEDNDGESGYVAMALPTGRIDEDLIVLASTGRGDALAIGSRELEPYESAAPDEEPEVVEPVRVLDYRQTVGTVTLPEGHPHTGLVQLLDEDGDLVHEVYRYDDQRSAWVRVGILELGADSPSSGRMLTAVALSPLTLAADVLTVFFLLLLEYDGPLPDAYSSGQARGTGPVPMHQRDAYWESLGEGRSKPGTRIPARPPIPGDWVFELRTDR